ncbi:MAG: DUF3237 family protein, partial [Sphingobium sp.]
MRNRLCTGLAAMLLLTASPSVNARDTLPPAPLLELAFDMTVLLGDAVKLGETPIAGRNIVPIVGGRITGPAINGTVMPGGWDWQLIRRDGCVQIKADYFIKTDDGEPVQNIRPRES